MKPGQIVFVGPARIEASFQGYSADGRVKVFHAGRQVMLDKSKVSFCRKKRPTAFSVGDAVSIEIHGIERPLTGEVIAVGPVKARVTEFDPIWNGAVVGSRDARIRREDSGAE